MYLETVSIGRGSNYAGAQHDYSEGSWQTGAPEMPLNKEKQKVFTRPKE